MEKKIKVEVNLNLQLAILAISKNFPLSEYVKRCYCFYKNSKKNIFSPNIFNVYM